MKRLALALTVSLWAAAAFAQSDRMAVLYDNDAHCSVEGYPVVAALRDSLRAQGLPVLLVSAGDYVFGNTLGAASHGEYIVRLMNAAGYDCAALGNHEFDYSVGQLLRLDSLLQAPMVCCNFKAEGAARPVLAPYWMTEQEGVKVAFVGVVTPSTIYCSSPVNFQDARGRYCYGFCAPTLAEEVQKSVDQARLEGARYVVLLSHLGDSDGDPSSVSLIAATQGIDVVIDAHDHHAIPQRMVDNRQGEPVLLTSTGSNFEHIGMLLLPLSAPRFKKPGMTAKAPRPSIAMQSRLLSVDSLRKAGCVSLKVADTLAAIRAEYTTVGLRKVAESSVELVAADSRGIRIARLQETNLGDLTADAYRVMTGADIGWINGGGLRANVQAGTVTFNDIFKAFPYENRISVVEVSGQEILDALEHSCRALPMAEGCFAQVSGLRFAVDTTVRSSVRTDQDGTFVEVAGPRRVHSVEVLQGRRYRPIDPKRRYTIASTDYLLLNGGDGLSFPSRKVLKLDLALDTELLEAYAASVLKGSIGKAYAKPQGRIRFAKAKR